MASSRRSLSFSLQRIARIAESRNRFATGEQQIAFDQVTEAKCRVLIQKRFGELERGFKPIAFDFRKDPRQLRFQSESE